MNTATENESLRTTADMAARLRVSPATILKWVRAGVIPAVRVGQRLVRFNEAAVLAALSDQKAGAQ